MRQATTVRLWTSLPALRGKRIAIGISSLCGRSVALAGVDTHREEALLRAPEVRGSIRWCLAGYPDQTPVRVYAHQVQSRPLCPPPRCTVAYPICIPAGAAAAACRLPCQATWLETDQLCLASERAGLRPGTEPMR